MKKILLITLISLACSGCRTINASSPSSALEPGSQILIMQTDGLHISEPDGSANTLVVPTMDGLLNAALSHNGNRVAYFVNGDYFVAEIGNGMVNQINQDWIGGVPFGMGWSPDDSQIAFDCTPGETTTSEICLLSPEGGPLQVLTQTVNLVAPDQTAFSGGAAFGSWSADGTQIVFTARFYPASGSGRASSTLLLLDVASGKLKTIFVERDQQTLSGVGYPSLTPDGQSVLFQASVDGISQIFVIAVNGRNLRQITHSTVDITQPVISPAGNAFFAFTAPADEPNGFGVPSLFTLDGELVQQLDFPGGKVLSWVETSQDK